MTRSSLIKTAAYLMAGLMTTLAVAWLLAATVHMHAAFSVYLDLPGTRRNVEHGSDSFSARAFLRFGSARRLWYSQSHRFGDREASAYGAHVIGVPRGEFAATSVWSLGGPLSWGELPVALREFRAGGMPTSGLEEARGWPALALCAEFEGFSPFRTSAPMPLEIRRGIALPPSEPGIQSLADYFAGSSGRPNAATIRALPLRPIWAGLAFDTLFYATLWWAVLAVPGFAVRHRRVLKGCCPRCAYDLRADFAIGCPECGWRR